MIRPRAVLAKWGDLHYGACTLIAALLLTSSACALPHAAVTNPWDMVPAESAIRLNVTNNYNGPMEVYAVGAGTSYRMGTVLPGFASQFVVREAVIGNGMVQFVAQTTRQAPIRSDQLLLIPGDVVDFEIATNPVNSIAIVRPHRR